MSIGRQRQDLPLSASAPPTTWTTRLSLQWHIQEPERQKLEELIAQFVEGFKDEVTGIHAPVDAPKSIDDDYMVAYIIGDHHLGMLAHHSETMGEDYDVKISQRLLESAIDRLVSVAPAGKVGVLVNLGDFMHVNDSTSSTPNSKNLLDSDGRYSKTIRAASNVIKRTVLRMLEKHAEVWLVNVRGNHDPDAALWLNEVMRLYFEDDPRVNVFDNASKFIWWRWGKNLVVTHHGDRIKMSNLHGSIVSNLRKEWGRSGSHLCMDGTHTPQEPRGIWRRIVRVLEHPSTRRRLARFLWLCQFSEYDLRDSSQRLRGRRQIKGERGAD
jgi:hypothetical protein